MPRHHVVLETPIQRTPRVMQVEGVFDLPPAAASRLEWDVHLPLEDRPWNLGLIVGPSGCGKTSIARALWPNAFRHNLDLVWPADQAVVDGFPEEMPAKEVVELLCSVGFSSPPAWLRPYHVLSTGQQFRVTLARLLAEATTPLVVYDEFTSVVDRTVAHIGSAALAKTVRKRQQQFIAVTCHEDIESWLNPDWVYRPDSNTFTWRLLRRRPDIRLTIRRVDKRLWPTFRHHHYLSTQLSPAATCFAAFWQDRPVAFSAWVQALAKSPAKREHRTVTLPDYQGVGVGHALSSTIASMWLGLGNRATSTTTHPAFIASRRRDPHWAMTRAPSFVGADGRKGGRLQHAVTRLTAGFAYQGPAMDRSLAQQLYGVPQDRTL